MSRRWWHIHVLRGEEYLGAQRHDHRHLDWWHGDGEYARDEDPTSRGNGVITPPRTVKRSSDRESNIVAFFTCSAPLWANQPNPLRKKIVEL